MSSQKAIFALILLCPLFLTVCMNNNSPTISADPISWRGSSAIYNSFEGKKEYSILFFYTDWCGYCHKMDNETFANPTVANILNQSFNSVRINAESDSSVVHYDSTLTGRQMKSFYNISAYPTTCIFKGDGQHIYTVIGYTNAIDFAAGLRRVLNGEYD